MTFAWMGWTLPTALFFGGIALALVLLGFLAKLAPNNEPRVGLFGVATQDRTCADGMAPLGSFRSGGGLRGGRFPIWLILDSAP